MLKLNSSQFIAVSLSAQQKRSLLRSADLKQTLKQNTEQGPDMYLLVPRTAALGEWSRELPTECIATLHITFLN